MTRLAATLEKAEFEARIFVSLGIVAVVTGISFSLFSHIPPTFVLLTMTVGWDAATSRTVGYATLALMMGGVSLLRMWAGTTLSARRVMAFRVQTDKLNTEGPYCGVRNPIYLADFLAMCAFALCLPPVGLLMPVLFYWHYARLIAYEERSLNRQFGEDYARYVSSAPRLLPSPASLVRLIRAAGNLYINREGIRHNALYALFIPGFIVAAVTHNFAHAVIIGLPGVIDWAVVHTKIGVRN